MNELSQAMVKESLGRSRVLIESVTCAAIDYPPA